MMMMRCGALDVDPFLISRNTLGNGKTTTQNLKDKSQMVVVESGGDFALGNAEVERWAIYLSKLKFPSLRSRNTLGDTSHNSNKLKQQLG